jgi:hypothetical protein
VSTQRRPQRKKFGLDFAPLNGGQTFKKKYEVFILSIKLFNTVGLAYTRLHIHTHTRLHLHTYTRLHIHTYTRLHIHTYTRLYTHTYTLLHLNTCTRLHIHIVTCTHACIYTHTHACIYTHTHACTVTVTVTEYLLHIHTYYDTHACVYTHACTCNTYCNLHSPRGHSLLPESESKAMANPVPCNRLFATLIFEPSLSLVLGS